MTITETARSLLPAAKHLQKIFQFTVKEKKQFAFLFSVFRTSTKTKILIVSHM